MPLNDDLISKGFTPTGSHVFGDGSVSNFYEKENHTVISISRTSSKIEEISQKQPKDYKIAGIIAYSFLCMIIGFLAGYFFEGFVRLFQLKILM